MTFIINAETKDKNTLTISQIQDLAVIYNDNAKNLQLQKKQLELQEQTLRNNRRDIENSINSMGPPRQVAINVAGMYNLSLIKVPLSTIPLPESLIAPSDGPSIAIFAQLPFGN